MKDTINHFILGNRIIQKFEEPGVPIKLIIATYNHQNPNGKRLGLLSLSLSLSFNIFLWLSIFEQLRNQCNVPLNCPRLKTTKLYRSILLMIKYARLKSCDWSNRDQYWSRYQWLVFEAAIQATIHNIDYCQIVKHIYELASHYIRREGRGGWLVR